MEDDLLDDRIASLTRELEDSGREITHLALATYDSHALAKVLNSTSHKPAKFNLKHPPQQMIPVFMEEVNELLKKSQEQQKFMSLYQHRINYCQHLSSTLLHVSNLIDKTVAIEDAILSVDLLLAAKLLSDFESMLRNRPDLESESNPLIKSSPLTTINPVYRAMEREYKLNKSRIVNKCKRLLQDGISIEFGRVSVNTILSGYIRSEDRVLDKPISLSQLFDVLIQLQSEKGVVEHYLEMIFKNMIKLFYKEKKSHVPNITITPYPIATEKSTAQGVRAEFIIGSMMKGSFNIAELQDNTTTVQENRSAFYNLGASKLPLSDVFDHLIQFISFISTQLFLGNEAICRTAGEILIQAPFNFLSQMNNLIVSQIPKHATDIPAYAQNVRAVVSSLQDKLEKCLYIETNGQLVDALSHLHLTFVKSKRTEILAFARHLLCIDYHNLMIAASGDALEDELSSASLVQENKSRVPDLDMWGSRSRDLGLEQSLSMQKLRFDTCQISMTVCRMLKYVHEVMGQVVTNFTDHLFANINAEQPRLINDIVMILFHSARDILEIFFSVVPTKYNKTIYENIRMGAVFFNDCHYIAHNCILLTFKYKNQLIKAIKDMPNQNKYEEDDLYCIGFMDFIPRLRKYGEECLNIHLHRLLDHSGSILDNINLKPDHQPSKKATTVTYNNEKEMHNCLRELNHFIVSMEDVLPFPTFNRITNIVLDELCQKLMAPVLVADCLTITGANEIQCLFKLFHEQVSGLLHISASALAVTTTQIPPIPAAAQLLFSSNTSTFTPTTIYRKFVVLADLLDYSLTDIAEALSTQRCNMFTSKEMIKLITALFEDTPKRQSLLDSIQQVSLQEASSKIDK